MKHPSLLIVVAVLAGWTVSQSNVVQAEPKGSPGDQQLRFFETRIRPLLIERCYECHSGDTSEGGLRLDLAQSLSEGGDSGPVAVPGDPDASLLVAAIRYEELEMPPDAPLSGAQQKDIEKWIREGAYWPIEDSTATQSEIATRSNEQEEPWWAAEPIKADISDLSVDAKSPTPIDRFVDQRLDQVGLRRAPPADRRRLIRRLSYDLLGVPPSPEAIDRFVVDQRPDAYRRLVDSMFADPAYGTRMGRLWLDLVRYAESDGWRADAYRPQAWRYRDFVVDAFNEKMPYDRFASLQLAGDEIEPANDGALAAVGFLRLGIFEYNQRDAEGQWQNIVDEMTDVTADVFLATGLACAKCHDHKFDPIPRADYFRLRSVFEPVLFVDREPAEAKLSDSEQQDVDRLLAELKEIESDDINTLGEKQVDRFPLEVQASYKKPTDQRTTYGHQLAYLVARQIVEEGLNTARLTSQLGKERYERRQQVLKQLDDLNANPYATADMITVVDANGSIRPTRLPGRTSGKSFKPGIPEVFGGGDLNPTSPDEAPQSSGRRTALASWIISPENPITARVMVNRLWQYLFGDGLVRSPNDFGRLGQQPTHPRLLDHLAADFIDSGWSIQSIQRSIVISATYQQSAVNPEAASARSIDSDNRWLWHRKVRRLDAEQYRDSMIIAMDRLIDHVGGPGPSGTEPRRSIYLRRFRNQSDEMLATLDAPPGVVGTARRDVTTTAPQSLMMLNSPRLIGVAQGFADRVRDDVQTSAPEQFAAAFVDRAHEILTGLPADDHAIELLSPLVNSGTEGQVDACHVLLNSNAFLFVE